MRSSAKLVAMQPTSQQITDYANALIIVNSYAYAITNQQLPVLKHPPANYSNFAEQFSPAKGHALNWSTNTFVSMTQLPISIAEQAADLFDIEKLFITAYLNMLIENPADASAKKKLKDALTIVQTMISNQVNAIGNIQTSLQQFSIDVRTDATTLEEIAKKALEDVKEDQDKIKEITALISDLNRRVANAQTVLTMAEIGMGVSIFVGIVGAVVCFIPGAQSIGIGMIVIGVAGLAASIAFTVIEEKNIRNLQESILANNKQISEYNQDVIQLQGISTQFTELQKANEKAQLALETIVTMWQQLATTIDAVSIELTAVDKDITSEQYQHALSDFQTAETRWNEVVVFAKAMAGINYSWQDASGNWHKYGRENPAANNGKVDQILPAVAVAV